MAFYLLQWSDVRTVYSKVEAKSKKEAMEKLIEGNLNHEYDWSGSGQPSDIEDIFGVEKVDKKTFGELWSIA